MRKSLTAVVAVGVLLATTVPGLTVTNGVPDGNRHPYVGIALQPAAGGGFFVCSGAALSPTTFLTAAHCFDPSLPAFVSYASQQPFTVVQGTVYRPSRLVSWLRSRAPGIRYTRRCGDYAQRSRESRSVRGFADGGPGGHAPDAHRRGHCRLRSAGFHPRWRDATADLHGHPVFRAKPAHSEQ